MLLFLFYLMNKSDSRIYGNSRIMLFMLSFLEFTLEFAILTWIFYVSGY
jgi:hypothetical protein